MLGVELILRLVDSKEYVPRRGSARHDGELEGPSMLIACTDGPDKSLNGIATKSDSISLTNQLVIGRFVSLVWGVSSLISCADSYFCGALQQPRKPIAIWPPKAVREPGKT